jgi:hypothetical protein
LEDDYGRARLRAGRAIRYKSGTEPSPQNPHRSASGGFYPSRNNTTILYVLEKSLVARRGAQRITKGFLATYYKCLYHISMILRILREDRIRLRRTGEALCDGSVARTCSG